MLDTNICIYIAKHQPAAVKAKFDRLKPGQVVMSVVTYGELGYGAQKSNQRSRSLELLEKLIRDIPVETLDAKAGENYAMIRATLEKQGRSIGNNDLWIAAHAMALELTLVTNNEREFGQIPGLSVENWAS